MRTLMLFNKVKKLKFVLLHKLSIKSGITPSLRFLNMELPALSFSNLSGGKSGIKPKKNVKNF
jgi:hypothetical protein